MITVHVEEVFYSIFRCSFPVIPSKSQKLFKISDVVFPGIAAHNPIDVINYVVENSLGIKALLIPFNAKGLFMGDQNALENLVDNTSEYSFVGMKTLAAGALTPKPAFEYISKHNISAVAIGMVDLQEAKEVTEVALKYLTK